METLFDSLPSDPGGRDCYVGATALDPRARLADSPLLPGAVLSVGGPGPDYHPARGSADSVLQVVSGPDAGLRVALLAGRHSIGRAAGSAVCLHDKEVSRKHALIEVSPDGAAVLEDAGSANGTYVDGPKITGRTPLAAGSEVSVGRNKLRWTPGASGSRALRVTKTADGRLEFDRVFAPAPTVREHDVDLPPRQSRSQNMTQMILSSAGGLVIGPLMYAGFHNPLMLVGSMLGVVMPFATYGVDNFQHRKEKRATATARGIIQEQVASLAAEEDRVRHLLAPGPAEIAEMAAGVRADLWPRDARSPLGLVLRVGVTDQEPSIRLRGERWEGFEMPVLRGVPVTVDLRETGVLGVVGTGTRARALLRWLILQLATLRSPDDLRLVLLTSGAGERLSWTRWLPHLDQGDTATAPCWIGNTDASRTARIEELGQLIAHRRAQRDGTGPAGPGAEGDVVVVIDGALALRNVPGIGNILRDGPEVGVYALCADSQGMAECHGLCEVAADGIRLSRTRNEPPVAGVPEGIDVAKAEEIARALAPMRDRMSKADIKAAIPYPVRLLDLLGIGVPTAEDILALWSRKEEGPDTRALIGEDATGPVRVDLALQGPHTMLGGATGAGKSILLQTLVTALLLANRPDELNLVLVDFKGGGAFLPFEHCPHVVALIRSVGDTVADTFSPADAARVLASVRAEMSNREGKLARFGAEIDNYWRARKTRTDLPPLPRLVMIFDEFARVLETSPDFLKELVSVSAKGRSLGVHLVLATQALQGKLSPELKNNVDLRISLRQNEPAESTEVLGVPDAVTLPGALRGRGMILVMKGASRQPRLFQSGYLGNPPPTGGTGGASVTFLRWTDLGLARPKPAVTGRGGPTDQELVITAIEQAAHRLGVTAPSRPLLPPLPAELPLERLADLQTEPAPGTAVPFGLADHPNLQAQPAYALDLAGTDRLMVAGGPQSGRTTFARALITSLATRFRPDRVHFYVVEHQPAGLSEYAGLPHCGGVFSPAEPDRIRRLVGWLSDETQRRAAARFAGPAGQDNPFIVVIVDGWEQFESRADPALADVSLGPTLREVMRIGVPLGVHIVATGGQDLLNGKVPAQCNQRLLLSFPNEDTRRAHLRGGMTTPPPIPGRAIDAHTGRHVQICQPTESAAGLAATVAAGSLAAGLAADLDSARMPRQFPSLPTRVNVADLPLPQPLPSASWIPVGVGGPEVGTVGIDLFDVGPHLMFISGPAGSGRTTAIATLARLLSWNGIDVLAVAPPQSPLAHLLAGEDDIRVITAAVVEDSVLREAAEPFGNRRYAVLLDDADRLTVQAAKQGFSDSPTLLDDIAHPAGLGQRALIIAANATPILSGNRRSLAKVTNEIVQNGIRILLTPAKRADARELGMTLEPDQYFTRPSGRGYLALSGTPMLIQLATAG